MTKNEIYVMFIEQRLILTWICPIANLVSADIYNDIQFAFVPTVLVARLVNARLPRQPIDAAQRLFPKHFASTVPRMPMDL